MDREPWPSTYDRELDTYQRPDPRPAEPIDPYRRLVVNPLLAVLSVVLSQFLMRASLDAANVVLFLASTGLLGVALLLWQFHCLDCGTTDWLINVWRHACPPAVARWREGRRGRLRFPLPRTQVMLWLYLLASATALILILFVWSR